MHLHTLKKKDPHEDWMQQTIDQAKQEIEETVSSIRERISSAFKF